MSAVATAAPAVGPVAVRTAAQPTTAPQPRHGWRPPATVPHAYRERRPAGDPTPLACTVAKSALEIALGCDGIEQLTRWIAPALRSSLLQQQSLARRGGYRLRGTVSVRRIRLCRVSQSAVEASIVALEGEVAHAIAMRLETLHGRWLITALEVG